MAGATVAALVAVAGFVIPGDAHAASYFSYTTISGVDPQNIVFDGSGNATAYTYNNVTFLTSAGGSNGTSYPQYGRGQRQRGLRRHHRRQGVVRQ